MKTRRFAALAPLALSLAFAACSGGGGSAGSTPRQPRQATLVVDTSTSAGTTLAATVLAVVLETELGQRTGNLVSGPTRLELGNSVAALTGFAMRGLADDRYAAMHVLFASGSVRVLDDRGNEEQVEVPSDAQTILFDEPSHIDNLLVLRHRGALDLRRNGAGKLVWQPALGVRVVVAQAVRSTIVNVLGVDRDNSLVLGEVPAAGGLHVTIHVSDDSLLTSSAQPGRLSRTRFLDLLSRGSELECRGMLDDKGGLSLSHGDDRGLGSNRPENEIVGRITSVNTNTLTVDVQVLSVRRGALDLPRQPLPVLTVTTQGTEIHLDGRRHEPLTFSALKIDQLVEVEWRGLATDNQVRADEIEITNTTDDNFGPELEGRISEIKLAERLLIVVPRKNDPLLVGGKAVSSATIVLTDRTRFFRKDQSPEVAIDLSQVTTQDRVWVIGRVLDATRVEAGIVRVRSE